MISERVVACTDHLTEASDGECVDQVFTLKNLIEIVGERKRSSM